MNEVPRKTPRVGASLAAQAGTVLMVVVSFLVAVVAVFSATRPFCDQPAPQCQRPSWGYWHVALACAGLVLSFLSVAAAGLDRRWLPWMFAGWLLVEGTLALAAIMVG